VTKARFFSISCVISETFLLVVPEEHRHRITPQRLEGVADLVIEIVSESDPGLDYREKLPRYRQARIDEIWILGPFKPEVLVERKGATCHQSAILTCGRIDSSSVPGFWIEASWLWQDHLPSTMAFLR
jgi:Uma2 family endonuclease